MFKPPELSACGNRNQRPKSHPTSGTPEEWFSLVNLKGLNLTGLSFDFFVDWSIQPYKTNVIWKKLLLVDDLDLASEKDNILNELHKSDNYILDYLKYFNKLSLKFFFLVFYDDTNWETKPSSFLYIEPILTQNGVQFNAEIKTLDDIKSFIVAYSGGNISIGQKGLIYASTNLECYLSHTNALYPGDADRLLIDGNNSPVCLIEYKKHTLNTPISQQTLSNYYPRPDGRKYNRLFLLKERIDPNVPYVVIYYPTRFDFTQYKVELIGGSYNNLTVLKSDVVNLPDRRLPNTLMNPLNHLMGFM